MGCQSEVYLEDNLVFSVTTHRPDTGVVTDADAPPDYFVYEDETGLAVLAGTMTILDNANTTGFYTELIACTAANGFESGRSYTAYIEATVLGDMGAICYGFRALAPASVSASSVGATLVGTQINILRGDSLSVTITGLGNISTRTNLWFTVKRDREVADIASIIQIDETTGLLRLNGGAGVAAQGSITVTNAAVGDITIAVDEVATAQLAPQACYYDVQVITAAGTVATLTEGRVDINADITRATS